MGKCNLLTVTGTVGSAALRNRRASIVTLTVNETSSGLCPKLQRHHHRQCRFYF